MNFRSPLIIFAVILLTACTAPTSAEEEGLFNDQTTLIVVELSAQEEALFDMVNEYRASQNLTVLEFSAEAYQYAEDHNEYMISKGQLSHDHFNARASNVSKITSANYVAENVAKDYDLIDDVLQGWLNSTSHKNTIEGDFTHATLSITRDAEGNPYYTQIFFRK